MSGYNVREYCTEHGHRDLIPNRKGGKFMVRVCVYHGILRKCSRYFMKRHFNAFPCNICKYSDYLYSKGGKI